MKYVDIARTLESPLRVFTSIERLAKQMKIHGIGDAGKLVKRTEMDAPSIEKLVKKREMGDPKVGKFGVVGNMVQKIEMGEPKTGKLVKKNEMGDPKVGNIGVAGQMVRKIEMSGSQAEKLVKKIETGDMKVGEMVEKMDESGDQQELVNRMRCWQRLVRKVNSSSVLTTSLERSCLGRL